MLVQVARGDERYMFRGKQGCTYASLIAQLRRLWSLEQNDALKISFVDDEGDRCTITGEAEWQAAVRLFPDRILLFVETPGTASRRTTAAVMQDYDWSLANHELRNRILERVRTGVVGTRVVASPNDALVPGSRLPPVIRGKRNAKIASAEEGNLGDDDEWLLLSVDDETKSSGGPTVPSNIRDKFTSSVTVFVNNTKHVLDNVSPTLKLADWLRSIGLTGTKIGCGEGGCGACTVVLTFNTGRGKHGETTSESVTVNSCMHPVCAMDGVSVTTTEGIGDGVKGYHPIQKALAENDGSQCGYCSPGMVMEMYGLLLRNPKPSLADIENNFDGNICRCTGYKPILKAMHTFAPSAARIALETEDGAQDEKKSCCSSSSVDILSSPQVCRPGTCCDVEDICASKSTPEQKGLARITPATKVFPYVPEEHGLKLSDEFYSYTPRPSFFTDGQLLWFTPSSVSDVYTLLQQYSSSIVRLVAGNTSIGVAKYYIPQAADNPTVFINVGQLSELRQITVGDSSITVGAAVTLDSFLQMLTANQSQGGTYFMAMIRHLRDVANQQVRNVASWAGNLMMHKIHPNFPSDLNVLFTAVNAQIVLSSSSGQTTVSVPDFMQMSLGPDQIIYSLVLPFPPADTFFDSYKVTSRHQNAHALVNGAFSISYTSSSASSVSITKATIVFGGVQTGIVTCPQTCAALAGKPLNEDTLAAVLPTLYAEVKPAPDPSNPTWVLTSPAYRQLLATSLFYKFVLGAASTLVTPSPVSSKFASATEHYVRSVSSGTEVYTPDQKELPVSQYIPKLASILQASGEATYIDDASNPLNGLEGAIVMSTVASGTISAIDASDALAVPGVVDFVSAKDISDLGGANSCGLFPGDEEVFASTAVNCIGQAVGMIVAITRDIAQAAAKLVKVTYGAPKTAPVFTIPEAIKAGTYLQENQYMKHIKNLARGDVSKGFDSADFVYTGELNHGSQAHFYMETQACAATLEEDGVVRLRSSCQGPSSVAATVAPVINRPVNKVIVDTRRAGGAFGGKISRGNPVAAAVAVAAVKLGVPVRMQYDRNTDFTTVGKREANYASYKIGVMKDGTIVAIQISFYNNAGYTYDTSFGDMDMCQLWADNTYFCANYDASAYCMRTNLSTNTAMRAPGALTGIFFMESMVERVSAELGLPGPQVREKNFYQVGQTTPYLQPLKSMTLDQVWSTLQSTSDYANRLTEVQTFNSGNRWRKRGIYMNPVKYPMGLAAYQCYAMINIFGADGTIMLTHSGSELGQGINTKVAQVVAYELGVDISTIVVATNSTEKIPNFGITGGSGTSESTCQAAINACQALNATLAPIKSKYPSAPWPQICAQAIAAGLNLSACANSTYSAEAGGYPFGYYVYAAACTEVELDVLTGEIQVLRSDIVYDNGISLNYAVDLGQVEGAFVQGLGFFFTEDVVIDANGRLISNGTWDYKPPCSQDIPIVFNVTMLDNIPNSNPHNVLSSKATGEPPYQLAASAFFAAKQAVYAARADAGITGFFQLDAPATVDRLQQLCGIQVTDMTFGSSSARRSSSSSSASVVRR